MKFHFHELFTNSISSDHWSTFLAGRVGGFDQMSRQSTGWLALKDDELYELMSVCCRKIGRNVSILMLHSFFSAVE